MDSDMGSLKKFRLYSSAHGQHHTVSIPAGCGLLTINCVFLSPWTLTLKFAQLGITFLLRCPHLHVLISLRIGRWPCSMNYFPLLCGLYSFPIFSSTISYFYCKITKICRFIVYIMIISFIKYKV